jgi:hypothetical protein
MNGAPYDRGSLAQLEHRVMTAWDQGASIERIAQQIGNSPYNVRRIVGRYVERFEDRIHDRACADGNAAFLAALAVHHPDRVAA